MIYPLVLELAADRIPGRGGLPVLGFSKQAFYRWRADPISQRDWDDAHLTDAAIDAHRDDPTLGYGSSRTFMRPAHEHRNGGCGGCARSSGCGRCTRRSGA